MPNDIIDTQPGIAAGIILAHAAAHGAVRAALEHARRAGQLLAEVKATIKHGEWLPWIAEHLPTIAETTIRGYMRVTSRWDELQIGNGVADLPLRDALKLLAEPKAKIAANVMPPLNALDAAEQAALQRRRQDLLISKKAADRASRIVEHTVYSAMHLLEDVWDGDAVVIGIIDDALLAQTDATLRPIWAGELREAAIHIAAFADALEARRRGPRDEAAR